MKTNPRSTLILAIIAIIVVGAGVGYVMIWEPLQAVKTQATKIRGEAELLELDLNLLLAEKRQFERTRNISLPADVKVSRGEYERMLDGLFRQAEFTPGTWSVTVQEADSKNVPMLTGKKPAYTKFSYAVKGKGDLYYITKFMHHFYQQPLLHAIHKITLQKTSESRVRGKNELDFIMNIEAVVVDGAPNRPTLFPISAVSALIRGGAAETALTTASLASGKGSPFGMTDTLAVGKRDYLAVTGKNIFFGPPPPPKKEAPIVETPPERDVSPFVKLTSIVGEDDGRYVASLRDLLNNIDYQIVQYTSGSLKVQKSFTLRGNKRFMDMKGGELVVGTEEGRNVKRWIVRRVTASEVILEGVDPDKPKVTNLALAWGGIGVILAPAEGKMFKMEIGKSLANAEKFLLTREAWEGLFKPDPRTAVSVEDSGR